MPLIIFYMTDQFLFMIFSLVVILFSAIIHEYMHGWMADRLGDPTAKYAGRLTLNPLAHIDLFGSILLPLTMVLLRTPFLFGYAKPVPFNPYNLKDQKYGSAKVAVAGPLANFIIALFFGLLIRILPYSASITPMLGIVVYLNLLLMIFNLLPIPPLDGSKVIAPFLSYYWQLRLAAMESYGMLILLFFIAFGFNLILPVINLFFWLITGQKFY